MPDRPSADAVLAHWRAVERDVEMVKREIADPTLLHVRLASLHAEAKRLRDEYRALIEAGDT